MSIVEKEYTKFTEMIPDLSPLNTLIIDHFKRWTGKDLIRNLNKFLKEKNFLADIIRKRASTQLLYRQPGVLLVYFSINHAPNSVAESGPLSEMELAPLYGDLGERLPSARV